MHSKLGPAGGTPVAGLIPHIDSRAVSLDVTYTYGGETKTKTIEFRKDGVGDRFEVVRNHVYIFNIKVTETPAGGGLKTDVETYVADWDEILLSPGYE